MKNKSTSLDNQSQSKQASDKLKWEEYSSLHDSFTEILSYENSRKTGNDIWKLNYI